MGGQFAAALKYAGYDAIIVQGKADRPVWLSIRDEKVEIKDARLLWGQGIRRTTVEINQQMGPRPLWRRLDRRVRTWFPCLWS